MQFKKGPYFADEGNFSAAGAANISYVNQLDRTSVSLSGGQDGWKRVFASGFVLRNSLKLFSNFTCFLDDADRGDQFEH